MNEEKPKLNITPKEKLEYRPERTGQELLNLHTEIDPGQDGVSSKRIVLSNEDQEIGSLNFYLPENSKTIEISQVIVSPDFRGNNLGMKLYEELITFAKERNFESIQSDRIVQGGAIGTWIELSKKYNVSVHPSLKELYEKLVKTYEEKKFFNESLTAPSHEHAFELDLK
jgi:GNAT superfamily N-acetyltransferase